MRVVHTVSKPLFMNEFKAGSALCCPPEPLRLRAHTPSPAATVLVMCLPLRVCGSSLASPHHNGFQAMIKPTMLDVPAKTYCSHPCFKEFKHIILCR